MSRSLLSVLLFIGLIFLSWNFYAQTKGIKLSELQPFVRLFEPEEEEEITPVAEPQKEIENQENFRIEEVFACTISLTSPGGTDNQTVCEGVGIIPITYEITGAPDVDVTNLPSGISFSMSGNTLTISGTPGSGSNGNYSYLIEATNGSCVGTQTETGNINVNSLPTPTFTAQPDASTCELEQVTYETQGGFSNYQWTFSGTPGTDYNIIN
ncbi:MAG: putative Ig domain-containing protein, partial [Algoriphagus sp.]|uniref:putative Ig domain-containing protein n=1 Tax=Algoriphagus sp. TaxID=1872435 RepID=UPI0017F2C62D